MFGTLEEFWDVFWHGNVKIMLFVVPIQCDTTVESAGAVFRTGVVFVDGVDVRDVKQDRKLEHYSR